jgi:hypothetical protein
MPNQMRLNQNVFGFQPAKAGGGHFAQGVARSGAEPWVR